MCQLSNVLFCDKLYGPEFITVYDRNKHGTVTKRQRCGNAYIWLSTTMKRGQSKSLETCSRYLNEEIVDIIRNHKVGKSDQ